MWLGFCISLFLEFEEVAKFEGILSPSFSGLPFAWMLHPTRFETHLKKFLSTDLCCVTD
jgi:hypothetical protein